MEKICGIYKITSPSGKIYIGKSVDIGRRFYLYEKHHCKSQTKLYHSLKKYGWQYHKKEIFQCSENILNELERLFIELFKTFNTKHGMNLLTGGDNKIRMSDDTKKRIGVSNKGIKNGMYGKKITENAKIKMVQNNSGELNYLSKWILNTETGIYYPCLREASEAHNMIKGTLWASLKRNKKNKYSFIYA